MTGVQTCALPIYDIAFVDEDIHEDLTKDDMGHNEQDDWDIDDLF